MPNLCNEVHVNATEKYYLQLTTGKSGWRLQFLNLFLRLASTLFCTTFLSVQECTLTLKFSKIFSDEYSWRSKSRPVEGLLETPLALSRTACFMGSVSNVTLRLKDLPSPMQKNWGWGCRCRRNVSHLEFGSYQSLQFGKALHNNACLPFVASFWPRDCIVDTSW